MVCFCYISSTLMGLNLSSKSQSTRFDDDDDDDDNNDGACMPYTLSRRIEYTQKSTELIPSFSTRTVGLFLALALALSGNGLNTITLRYEHTSDGSNGFLS